MKLESMHIHGFRCYDDPIELSFHDMTAIIGRNDIGKSTLLEALDVFFNKEKIEADDFSVNGELDYCEICCSFSDISHSIVIDEDYPTSLADEFLLDDKGLLTIVQRYSRASPNPKAKLFAKALHPSNEGVSDLILLKQSELVSRARKLEVDLSNANRTRNSEVRSAIRSGVGALEYSIQQIPLDKEDARKVWQALKSHLPTFALFQSDRPSTDQDSEAQDPLVGAIKETLKDHEEALNKIVQIVHDRTNLVSKETLSRLRELDPDIASTLNPRITPKSWHTLFQASITGDEDIPLNKRGSGVRRLVLLSFFRAKAERESLNSSRGSVIYAVEEPETSQHPRNQRLLLQALMSLSARPGCQVIITTHNPMLARAMSDSDLRYIKRTASGQRNISLVDDDLRSSVASDLGVLPDHGVKLFLGVEGPNDMDFLRSLSSALLESGMPVDRLDEHEIDGRLIFVPCGGSTLSVWQSRLQGLNIPENYLFDRDCEPPSLPKYQDEMDAFNERDNCNAICTTRCEIENYLHPDAVRAEYLSHNIDLTFESTFGEFEDVPDLVASKVFQASGGVDWHAKDAEFRRKKTSLAKRRLASAARYMTRDLLAEIGVEDEVALWFRMIGERIHR